MKGKKAEFETEELTRWLIRIVVFGLLVAGVLVLINYWKGIA